MPSTWVSKNHLAKSVHHGDVIDARCKDVHIVGGGVGVDGDGFVAFVDPVVTGIQKTELGQCATMVLAHQLRRKHITPIERHTDADHAW